MKNANRILDNIGHPVNLETGEKLELKNELDHLLTCNSCGQSIDMRNLVEVLYHEKINHKPLKIN